MAGPLVCNINFFLYTRFVFGFYHEFRTPKPVRWLAKCYCCLICASVIFFYFNIPSYGAYPKCLMYFVATEYFMCMLTSLLNNNKHLLQYYKKLPLLDTSANTYRQMRVCLIGYLCIMLFIRLCGFIKVLIFEEEYNLQLYYFSFIDFIMWFVVLLGRSNLFFVFALLYSRIRLMRQTLESNDFDCRNQGKHHPRRYIQMYEAIMDGLEASNEPVNIQLFIFVVFCNVYYLVEAFAILYITKHCYYSEYCNNWNVLWFLVEVLMNCSPLFLATILADLVTTEVQEMLVIVLRRRIACKNERDREEIQKLFQFLKRNPFEYSLWRVVPLNVRSLLSVLSFTVTTIIAILQIGAWIA